jgi:hypothetical protein
MMKKEEVLKKIPKEGFLKVTDYRKTDLSSQQKTVLNRKGNQLFNEGKYDQAERIFLTTGYSDGIMRMGDHYYNNNNMLEAFRMYVIAPAPDKKEMMIEKMAGIVRYWLHDNKEIVL